jgi:hypothetical protein
MTELAASWIRAGRWEGRLTGAAARPEVEVTHAERALPDLDLRPDPEGWAVSVPIPPDALSDGVQTFLVQDRRTGQQLGSFTVTAGTSPDDDLRAEVDLLRAELDLLKRAFRRHCIESSG